jgi:membrane fusion protein, multidrug efflux system
MPASFRLVSLSLLPMLAIVGATLADEPATITVGGDVTTSRLVALGQVQAVRQAVLAAQATGRVTEVLVHSGETVQRGQVLLRIDSPAARATAEAGGAEAAAAAAQLVSAEKDFERAKRLHAKQYLSDAALERMQAQLKAVEAKSTAAAAQAKAAREIAGWEELRAPYDGRVTSVGVAAGDLASPGQPLVGVYAPGPMRVLADIPADVADQLATDQAIELTYDAGGCAGAPKAVKTWTAIAAIDPRSRSVAIRVELPELPGCVPGALVRASVPLKSTRSSLTLPRTALIRRGELDAVYVVEAEGRVMLRQVRVGEPVGTGVEVLAGLEAGEKVLRDAVRHRPATAGEGESP